MEPLAKVRWAVLNVIPANAGIQIFRRLPGFAHRRQLNGSAPWAGGQL